MKKLKALLVWAVKRIKCKHKDFYVAYSGMTIYRYKCKNCGKDKVVKRDFETRL
tara:strand:+ start:789 stop:950 length:162 start_codon:yes stop_codon:yes gene_type:complete